MIANQLGEKWLPFDYDEDNLPPTVKAEINSPAVLQSKAMMSFAILRQLDQYAQRNAVQAVAARRRLERRHIGRRVV